MHNHFDLIILGGGCAGLSLSSQLAKYGTKTPKTLIIEQRDSYRNDRTWCFWDIQNPNYKFLTRHAWPKFQIKNRDKHSNYDCKKYQYLMLSGYDFYLHSLKDIETNPNISLMMHQKIEDAPVKIDSLWHIKTKTSHFTSNLVVDTRLTKDLSHCDATLWQSFLGYEIKIDADLFDPDKFILMDFDHSFKNGLAFIYFLPTSRNQALIEYTIFSERFIPHQEILPFLHESIKKYIKDIPYQILRNEHGILPMGSKIKYQTIDSSYLFSGLFAGAARPSSGYAFQRIQGWAKICAKSIVMESKLSKFPKDPWMTFLMDGLFLNVLKNNPNIAASIFDELFKNCDLKTVVKFMSDQATTRDYLEIMKSLPSLPFIKSIPSYLAQILFAKASTQK